MDAMINHHIPEMDGLSWNPTSPHLTCQICGNLTLRLHEIYHPVDHSIYHACVNCYVGVSQSTVGYCPNCAD